MPGIVSGLFLVVVFGLVAILCALLALRLLRTTRRDGPAAGERPDA
ncbi:MAG TPA: hypothetical protein VMH35_27925 [Streptosporangiaceae bacterium]|nr:hypothetical protein [Streptosporangiaceae bacterium]